MNKPAWCKQRLPRKCVCGGSLIYAFGPGRYIGNHCDRCTPVVSAAPPPPAAPTTLAWSPTLDCGEVSHVTAVKAVAKLNEQAFQGHTDWRLPEIRELLSLVDYTRRDPAIDTDAFPDTKSGWYWTSSPVAGAPGCAWVIHFYCGYALWLSRYYVAFVRAVRGPCARASQ